MGLFSKKPKEPKPIGEVVHYFSGIGVAIVRFNTKVKVGEKIHFKGATTDFKDAIKSMQYDHKEIESAKKGQEVGIKVKERTREGDGVYSLE